MGSHRCDRRCLRSDAGFGEWGLDMHGFFGVAGF